MTLTEARKKYRGWVIVLYPFNVGGQLKDRWNWMSEKDGEVLDYDSKDTLVCHARKAGEKVVVLTLRRDGQVSSSEDVHDSQQL